MKFFNALANSPEGEAGHAVVEHAEASAMFPDFLFAPEHFGEEVEVQGVFESGYQANSWHFIAILWRLEEGITDFGECVLFHEDVGLTAHVLHLLDLADFQGVELVWELAV